MANRTSSRIHVAVRHIWAVDSCTHSPENLHSNAQLLQIMTIFYYSGMAGRDDRVSWEIGLAVYETLLTHHSLFILTRRPREYYLHTKEYTLITSQYWIVSLSRIALWRTIASVRPPYGSSRVLRVCCTIGCCFSSGWWGRTSLSNWHSHTSSAVYLHWLSVVISPFSVRISLLNCPRLK